MEPVSVFPLPKNLKEANLEALLNFESDLLLWSDSLDLKSPEDLDDPGLGRPHP
jgi:hypothetical protein